ncbi:GlxA family transcriptional regulator [Dactylosporangium aurantiacum]|uniref:GlxA family transcriptional regulator n=1 Tax=Dactylosporangium aurantiacum TaxID=35754 RepID=UPI000AE46BA0|nr:DJ-1/PfpI family protein [Dactylosporangium aurantiacum]MDG6107697.1 DJ-1/PfpI family protein [Dactylosporangium aurantiacum]
MRRIGILVHDNVTMLDVAGPADVFGHANAFGANYRTVLISVDGCDATASNGLGLRAGVAFADAGPLDTVIVPGAYGMVDRPLPASLVDAVATLTASARRTTSVCTGSFLLAQVGLLDGRNATTHWGQTQRFRAAYPRVKVQDDVLFVRDGSIITAAGLGSGMDLALTLVEDDHGPAMARDVARQMLIFMQRPGGLSQFSARSRASVPADRTLRVLLDTIAADPAARYSLAEMARVASVSTRQLARLFHEELRTTPTRYVESVRIEAAQAFLQHGHTVAMAAKLSGFGSAETLRRVFVARLGVSPSGYAGRLRRT